MLDKYNQNLALRFSNTNIEQNYKEDCSKVQSKTLDILLLSLSISSLFIISSKPLTWYHVIYIIPPFFPSIWVKIPIVELSSLLFLKESIEKETIPELTASLLPSFLCTYFFWKHWAYFLFLCLFKFLILQLNVFNLNLLIVTIFYTLLSVKLEKDLRFTWKRMKKHKESNHAFRELWLKNPFPAFIINQKYSIVFCNNSFISLFGKGCKFEDIFKSDNLNSVTVLLKKVFLKDCKEEIIIKEKNETWMLFIRLVEWRYERCAEVCFIELLEDEYSEKIFSNVYSSQDHCLVELKELIFDCFENKSKISSGFYYELYLFCINIWSFQAFLEQQAEFIISNEVKCLNLQIEIANTIDVLNIKNIEPTVNFVLSYNPGNYSILVNESRLKMLLFVLVDYSRTKADKKTLIEFSLFSYDYKNNTSKYELKVSFQSSGLNEEELREIFCNNRKDLEDFQLFTEKFNIAYSLFYINTGFLAAQIKEVSYTHGKVNILFTFKFNTSLLTPTSSFVKLSSQIAVRPFKIIWQDLFQYRKTLSKSFQVFSQGSLAVFPKVIPKNPISAERRNKANSKNNDFAAPHYPSTRVIKKFLFSESCCKINLEKGVFKVLIVDDISQNRSTLKQLLSKLLKVSCEEASNGLLAVEMFNNYASAGFKYRIIFMDLVMPKMNGFEASSRIRQIEKENEYPVSFICAVTGNENVAEKCVENEMNHIALKPLSLEILSGVIEMSKEFND